MLMVSGAAASSVGSAMFRLSLRAVECDENALARIGGRLAEQPVLLEPGGTRTRPAEAS